LVTLVDDAGGILALLLIAGVVGAVIYGGRWMQDRQLQELAEQAKARLNVRGSEPRFETFEFPNSPAGQQTKNAVLTGATALGWVVSSETITAGRIKGGEACCLAAICLPFAFLAGRTDGKITVTLAYKPAGPL
jgi:hypothetical protein